MWTGGSVGVVFSPEFTAVCDTCAQTTMWFKANRAIQVNGRVDAVKGYKCAECETFEEKVLDARGQIHARG